MKENNKFETVLTDAENEALRISAMQNLPESEWSDGVSIDNYPIGDSGVLSVVSNIYGPICTVAFIRKRIKKRTSLFTRLERIIYGGADGESKDKNSKQPKGH